MIPNLKFKITPCPTRAKMNMTYCDNPECNEGAIVNPETGICPRCGGWTKDITESANQN